MTIAGIFWTWALLSAPLTAAVLVVLVHAVRTGQFRHQDHARYLPLEAADDASPQRKEV